MRLLVAIAMVAGFATVVALMFSFSRRYPIVFYTISLLVCVVALFHAAWVLTGGMG